MGESLRLLIVDDSADDAELLRQALRRGGYEPTAKVVDTPETMRDALEGEDWDAITSDHAMPLFSAPASLALARELRPDLPFIIVSGEIDLGLAVSLLRAGAHDYIQKSNLDEVAPAIGRALHAAQQRREANQSRQALEESELRYRRIFETAGDGILILEAASGEVDDANPCLTDLLGYAKPEILRKPLWELCKSTHKDAVKRAFAALRESGYVCYRGLPLQTRDGRELDLEFVGKTYVAGNARLVQCNIRSPARAEEQRPLPDRTLFQDRLSQAINLAERNSYKLSLLYLDLDDFETVFRALGRESGDEVLNDAASRILRRVRVSDTVARVGSGELAVLLPRITNPGDAAIVAKKIIDALIEGAQFGGSEQDQERLTGRIGIAIFPTDGPDMDALLRVAGSTRHRANQTSSSYGFGTA